MEDRNKMFRARTAWRLFYYDLSFDYRIQRQSDTGETTRPQSIYMDDNTEQPTPGFAVLLFVFTVSAKTSL